MASVKIKISPADHGRRMPLEDFINAEVVGAYRYELARGVIEVTEVPNDAHGQIIDNIREALGVFRQRYPDLIRRIAEGGSVQLIIPEWESERHPDLAVIFRDARANERGRRMPSLVIEVVSRGRQARDRDYLAKREEYLTFGIEEYWIVDPQSREVTVLNRQGNPATWSGRIFRNEDLLLSQLLPDLAVSVSMLWVHVED